MIRPMMHKEDGSGVEDLESLAVYSFRHLPPEEFKAKLGDCSEYLARRIVQTAKYKHGVNDDREFEEYTLTLYFGEELFVDYEIEHDTDGFSIVIDGGSKLYFRMGWGEHPHIHSVDVSEESFRGLLVHLLRAWKGLEQDVGDVYVFDIDTAITDVDMTAEEAQFKLYSGLKSCNDVSLFVKEHFTRYHKEALKMWLIKVVNL